jgi:hypothetical protein
MATEWAFINLPKIEPALGTVVEFTPKCHPDGHINYGGRVKDQQHNTEIQVFDNHWPMYARKPPAIKSAVIINWVHITEPHICIQVQRYAIDVLLPVYAREFIGFGRDSEEYWVGWLDTKYPT